ncbi:hypothetical protein [Bacillus salipaludis]|uniref:Uncharacterized protein n=1 Tax=Bacillus salipaludis TaxID=2547811 RepID=A0AA90TVX3_9BACI|nr:hypothetical protein [Bacillus salipaludis]MDQ6598108.1 hypothetical protein [Bacillus salipaludis]
MPYPEIVQYVVSHWTKDVSTSEADIQTFVDLALHAPRSYFEEDESGLWGIKSQIDESLSPIIEYVKNLKKPFQLRELTRRFRSFNTDRELREFLLRDIRFTELDGTAYWMLSEWELINDQVYKYMQKREIETADKREIYEIILSKYNLDKEISIFFPEMDRRFTVRNNIISIEVEKEEIQNTEIVVPELIREELARQSMKLLDWVNRQQGEFKLKNCITEILTVKGNHPSYPSYFQALEDFFETVPSLVKVGKGRWINVKAAPDLELNQGYVSYSVRNSVPVIENVEELAQFPEQDPLQGSKKKDYVEDNDTVKLLSYFYSTISYYERVKGYLVLPINFAIALNLEEEKKIGKTFITIEGFNYDCWLRIKNDKVYCYGNGIFDFYTDYMIEPGSRLKIELGEQTSLVVNLMGMDERYALEQERFLDIGKLVEESKRVNKSIFTIMCEVMATYPSGIHWTMLLDKVNEIRSTTKNTVTNLLSKNDCFVNLPDKKGYWRLNISKLSGYYVDENDQSVMQDFEPDESQESPSNNHGEGNVEKQWNSSDKQEYSFEGLEKKLTLFKTDIEQLTLFQVDTENALEKDVEEISNDAVEEEPLQITGKETSTEAVMEITPVNDRQDFPKDEINGFVAIESQIGHTHSEKKTTNIVQVGSITSGKKYILSFIDTSNKQINRFPFIQRNGTQTNGEKDGHYNYNYHWDLREEHDIEAISNQFPEIFSYRERFNYIGLENIMEAQYTELIKYKIFCLINRGEFIFNESDQITIIEWNGPEINPPEWYTKINSSEDNLHIIEQQIDAVTEIEEKTDELADPIKDNDPDKINVQEMGTLNVSGPILDISEDAGYSEIGNQLGNNTITISSDDSQSSNDPQDVLVNTEVCNQSSISNDLLLEEVNKMENRIQILEKKLLIQEEDNNIYRKKSKVFIGLAICIGFIGIIINLFK